QAIARTPNRESTVQPASFTPARDPLAPVARGRAPDTVAPRPMPTGPSSELTSMPSQGDSQWRRAGHAGAPTVARNGGASPAAAPPPAPGPPLAPTPAPLLPIPTTVPPPPGFGPRVLISGPGIPPPPGNNPSPPVTVTGPGANNKVIGQAGPPCSTGCGPNCGAPAGAAPACGHGCSPAAQGAWGGCRCGAGPRFVPGSPSLDCPATAHPTHP